MQDYTRILAWRRARALTVAVDEATRTIRPQAAPGLRSQLMRAAMSISATIAEGAGRESRRDFARFVTMATSSASEVEHHLTVCADLRLIDGAVVERLTARSVEIRRSCTDSVAPCWRRRQTRSGRSVIFRRTKTTRDRGTEY